ncbi:hypothetical protein D3C84_1198140 [compost metagenome]
MFAVVHRHINACARGRWYGCGFVPQSHAVFEYPAVRLNHEEPVGVSVWIERASLEIVDRSL